MRVHFLKSVFIDKGLDPFLRGHGKVATAFPADAETIKEFFFVKGGGAIRAFDPKTGRNLFLLNINEGIFFTTE